MIAWPTSVVTSTGYTGPVGREHVSGSSSTLLTIGEVRSRLRLPFTDEDLDLQAFIESAVLEVEASLGRALAPQTWRWWYDTIPCGRVIVLPEPATAIVAVTTYATDDDTTGTVLADTAYALDALRDRLVMDEAASWPAASLRGYNAVSVEAEVGYATASAVPMPLLQAVHLTVQGHYLRGNEPDPDQRNRAAVVARLLAPYRYRMGVA